MAERIAAGAAEDAPDEDIHSLVERLLYEEVGEVAGKLHTGRSRNDQVATDTRLWALRAGARLGDDLAALQRALLDAGRGERRAHHARLHALPAGAAGPRRALAPLPLLGIRA